MSATLERTEVQTIAVQRGLPIAPPPFVTEHIYVRWMTRLVRAMRRIPGLR